VKVDSAEMTQDLHVNRIKLPTRAAQQEHTANSRLGAVSFSLLQVERDGIDDRLVPIELAIF